MPRLRPFLFLSLVMLASHAAADWPPDASGMPKPKFDDGMLYALDTATGTFWSMKESELKPERVYLKYFAKYGGWYWLTREDRRPMMSVSKLQGKRLGVRGAKGLDWYALEKGNLKWKKNTDRKRPRVLRWTGKEAVVSETYPENWISYGGEVEPDPNATVLPGPAAPACEILVEKFIVPLGTAVPVTLFGYGEIKRAVLDGLASDTAPIKMDHLAKKMGEQLILGSVSGPGGNATCWAKYEATPSD